jgi:hypothetical protein
MQITSALRNHVYYCCCFHSWQGLSRKEYEEKKEVVANEIIRRLEKKLFPGLQDSIVLKEVSFCLPCCDSVDRYYCLILIKSCINFEVLPSNFKYLMVNGRLAYMSICI